MTKLSDEALDMLINAGAGEYIGTGSPVGVGSALDELVGAGLATAKGNLTKVGARRARREAEIYFNRP